MSSSIGTVNDLVAVIQRQLSARAPLRPAPARVRTAPRGAAKQLNALIELRVRQIRPDDPQRGRKALRVFLEAVLISHFGEPMMADARFFQLVDEVQDALEGDPDCKDLMAAAIGHLLSPK